MCAYLISTDLYGGGMFPCAVNLSILAVFQHVYSTDQNVLSGNLLKFNGKLAETLMVCKIHTLTFEFRGNNQTPKKLNKTKKAEKMAALL